MQGLRQPPKLRRKSSHVPHLLSEAEYCLPQVDEGGSVSVGEETFRLHCVAYGIPHEVEYRFCRTRRWRADFYFPKGNLLVEIEGGTWNQGRHNRAVGYRKDLEKYNEATKMGYRLLRYTTEMVAEGKAIDDVRKVLEAL